MGDVNYTGRIRSESQAKKSPKKKEKKESEEHGS